MIEKLSKPGSVLCTDGPSEIDIKLSEELEKSIADKFVSEEG